MAFPKYPFDRIVWTFVGILIDKMNSLNDRTIQLSYKFVSRSAYIRVLGDFFSCLIAYFNEYLVSFF